MTWEQLQDLNTTGLFEIESHTFWHPNFRVEKRRRAADDYREFAESQLYKPREVLGNRLAANIDLLAWPYGIYDDELINLARKAGYIAAFTLERRKVSREDNTMALPPLIVSDNDRGKAFEVLLAGQPAIARSPIAQHSTAPREDLQN